MKKLGNVFILGDSYSTFKGHNPDGYDYWYSDAETPHTNVRRVEETWWHQMMSETESNMILNCSYSGTTVCNRGYEGADCREISFIGRLDKLIGGGFFKENKIDTFFIFGGTNDSWAEAPVGELKYEKRTEEDLYEVLPAFCYLLERVTTEVPEAYHLCVINTELKEEITENFKVACKHYGVDYVALKDISKWAGHPNIDGMKQIKEQVLASL